METLHGGSNPWLVQNLNDFSYLCCPECDYRTKVEGFFEHHAVNKHPWSIEFFSAEVADEHSEEVSFSADIKEEENEYDESSHLTEVDLKATVDTQRVSRRKQKLPTKTALEESEDIKDATNGDMESENETKEASKIKERIKIEAVPGDTSEHECLKCSEVIIGIYNYSLHLKRAHGKDSKLWPCSVCDYSSTDHNSMKRHVKSVHLKIKVKCEICGMDFSPSGLRQHMKVSHLTDRNSKSFTCTLCDFATHALRYLKAHVKNVHEKDTHNTKCDQCDRKFQFQSELQNHIAITHLKQKRLTFMCDKCGKGFTQRTNLQLHTLKNACESQEPIKCDRCEDEFSKRNYFILHYRAVHKGYPMPDADLDQFMCDRCPNTYDNKVSLKMHIYTKHSGYKPPPYKGKKCKQCDQTFPSSIAYHEHFQRVHKNSTPFKCTHCDKSYGTKARLKNHTKLVHQRVKCDECSQEICNDFMLQRHKATVHGTKPTGVIFCPCCPLFYKTEASLNAHIAKHHPEHPVSL